MEIKDFSGVRVGSGFPACFDIEKLSTHESLGVVAKFFDVGDDCYFQLRKSAHDPIYALFAFGYLRMELPFGWEDSELIWDSRSVNEQNR